MENEKKINWRRLLVYIICGALALCAFILLSRIQGCKRNAEWAELTAQRDSLLATSEALQDSTIYYKGRSDSVVGKLYESQLHYIAAGNLGRILGDSLKEYKKLLFAARIKLNAHRTDTTWAYYTDTVTVPGPCDTMDNYIRVPREYAYSVPPLSFTGIVTRDGLSVVAPYWDLGELTLNVGWKTRPWKKPLPVADITTNNGFVYVTSVKNFYVQPPPVKWYYTRMAFFLYGMAFKTAVNFGLWRAGYQLPF